MSAISEPRAPAEEGRHPGRAWSRTYLGRASDSHTANSPLLSCRCRCEEEAGGSRQAARGPQEGREDPSTARDRVQGHPCTWCVPQLVTGRCSPVSSSRALLQTPMTCPRPSVALVRPGRELGVSVVSIDDIQPASGTKPAFLAGRPVLVVLAKVRHVLRSSRTQQGQYALSRM